MDESGAGRPRSPPGRGRSLSPPPDRHAARSPSSSSSPERGGRELSPLPQPASREKRKRPDVEPPAKHGETAKKSRTFEFNALQQADQAAVSGLHGSSPAFAGTVSQSAPMVRVGLAPNGKGTMGVTIGPGGAFSAPHDVPAPRSAQASKKKALTLGESTRKRFSALPPEARRDEVAAMRDLGEVMTATAFESGVFSQSKEAYDTLLSSFNGKKFTSGQFRGIEGALDEHTQSAVTASFHQGFQKPAKDEHPDVRKDAADFGHAFLTAQSALRLDTAHTVAPVLRRDVERSEVDDAGKTTKTTSSALYGHQHVTRQGIAEVERGQGVSALAHGDRAQSWVDAMEGAHSVTRGVFVPAAASLAAAGSGTMRGMAHPLAGFAGAADHFGKQFVQDQTRVRDSATKVQTNTAAKAAGLPVDKRTQRFDAPKQATPYPSSPIRVPHKDD